MTDFKATGQKEGRLADIARMNGIDVPRLRGYRLMSEEIPFTEEEIEKSCNDSYWDEYKTYAFQKKPWNRSRNARFDPDKRQLRGMCRKMARDTRKQLEMFNKYAGQPNILMIHARIGGDWPNDGGALISMEKWFLDYCYDGGDHTYCDIYARFNTNVLYYDGSEKCKDELFEYDLYVMDGHLYEMYSSIDSKDYGRIEIGDKVVVCDYPSKVYIIKK